MPMRTHRLLAGAAVIGAGLALGAPLLYTPTEVEATTRAPAEVTAFTSSFAEVVERVQPAVVNISTVRSTSAGGGPGQPAHPLDELMKRHFGHGNPTYPPTTGQGSGFIVSADGLVVTNHHVVAGADDITVTLNDGRQLSARLRGSDPKTDVALLEVDSDEQLPAVSFGDSDRVRAGDWVLAIGNPFGLGGTVTAGIVSARGRDIHAGPYDDFIQVDAPINRGNSGGPLFDAEGRVIGINTAIVSPNGGSVGIGFAIPAAIAAEVVADLRDHGTVERGWLGVEIQSLNPSIATHLDLEGTAGALVVAVVADSPAEHAGLAAGDVVLSGNNRPIETPKDLSRLVASLDPSSPLDLRVWRRGQTVLARVRIGQVPGESIAAAAPAAATPRMGVTLAPLSPALREQYGIEPEVTGTVVVAVEPGSPAAREQIRPGDVIVQVGQNPVHGPADVLEGVREARDAHIDSVLLLLTREGRSQFVAVPLG